MTAGKASPAGFDRGQVAWALFDWANQPYFTLILTFIFGPYFAARVVGDTVAGQAEWGYFQAMAGLVIAFASPALGALADAGGKRKPWCAAFAALGVAGATGLWLAAPGGDVLQAGLMMAAATIGFEIAIVFNNAMLACLVVPGRVGRLSGFGWGLGYLGGLAALAIMLLGFYLPAEPWLGLDRAAGEDARISGPFTAFWFILFSAPFFLMTPDRAPRVKSAGGGMLAGLATLVSTLRHLRRYRRLLRFLMARMVYADGLAALFSFGGIFAAGLFGWGTTQLGVFGLVTIVFSALGCFPGGWADDRFGSRATILAGLAGLILALVVTLSLRPDGLFFGLIRTTPATGGMTSPPELVMMAAAALMGICAGPVQAASRSLMVHLTPPEMSAEFFGLFAFSGKATAFVAPFLIGLLTAWTGWQAISLVVVALFLLAGGLLLRGLKT